MKNLTILYERYLSQTEIDNWTTIRETGLTLRWWMNNSEGHQVLDPKYLEQNKNFIKWINAFYHIKKTVNVSIEELIEIVQRSANEYKNAYNDDQKMASYDHLMQRIKTRINTN